MINAEQTKEPAEMRTVSPGERLVEGSEDRAVKKVLKWFSNRFEAIAKSVGLFPFEARLECR